MEPTVANVMDAGFMASLMTVLAWCGIYGALALGALGSIIGCSIAGKSAIGALLEVEGGYGKFIGVSGMPASQVIYGMIVMFTLGKIGASAESAWAVAVIGLMAGGVLMYSAIKQGQCIAAAIKTSKTKPEVFGISIVPATIVETFALFAFIFAVIISQSI